jgi:hypothetical protein
MLPATHDSMRDTAHGQYLAQYFQGRTREQYDTSVCRLSEGDSIILEGIKSQSVFHYLPFYHVCNPGLPPCIGHDVFEDIMQLYLAYLVDVNKWFTYASKNGKSQMFVCRGAEARDRPAVLTVQTGTVVGHAVQVWNLIRFLLVLIGLK